MDEGATRAHTRPRDNSDTFRDPSARGLRRGGLTPGNIGPGGSGRLGSRAELCGLVQKSDEKFWRFRFFSYLCRMDTRKFIITGFNKLTRTREQLSRPMSEMEASERLQREVANRKYQRYQPYSRLKMQHLDAVQLTLNFKEYE